MVPYGPFVKERKKGGGVRWGDGAVTSEKDRTCIFIICKASLFISYLAMGRIFVYTSNKILLIMH